MVIPMIILTVIPMVISRIILVLPMVIPRIMLDLIEWRALVKFETLYAGGRFTLDPHRPHSDDDVDDDDDDDDDDDSDDDEIT